MASPAYGLQSDFKQWGSIWGEINNGGQVTLPISSNLVSVVITDMVNANEYAYTYGIYGITSSQFNVSAHRIISGETGNVFGRWIGIGF